MSWMFELRGELSKKQTTVLGILGVLLFLLLWFFLTLPFQSVDLEKYYQDNYPEKYNTEIKSMAERLKSTGQQDELNQKLNELAIKDEIPAKTAILNKAILPPPGRVFRAYAPLIKDYELFKHTGYSVGLNIAGYVKALIFSIIFGFAIGLIPLFRGLFKNHINAIRFVPLAAVTGIFIQWYGIDTPMKITFLSFGIIIYLLPVIVQRIDEVKDVYLKTVYTLGATDWQTIKTVYLPSVLSRLFDDIRILTAISWTYIIVAETINSEGGIGSLIYNTRRFARIDQLFALILLIILIGVVQDMIFRYLDREFFPHKYQTKKKYSDEIEEDDIFDNIFDFGFTILTWILLAGYLILVVAEYTNVLGGLQPLSYLFNESLWAIHLVFISIVLYKGNKIYNQGFRPKLATT